MSDFIESLFQGVDILIDKKLENIAYDTTEVCTIVDSSDRKNGKYRVTNGSVSYIAYSDNDKFREGDQVRVTIPNGDFSQKKFILGKYVTDEESSPITYVSPLESVVNISGNLLGSKGSEEYGILANGPEKSKLIWKQSLSAEQFRNLQDSNVYNILILKADFKTLLYNYKYIEGSYGLLVELLVRPSVDSSAKIRRVITLDSSEMFGNPYNFAIYATQAKTINIVTVGVIEEIALHLYQKGDFKNDRQEYIAPPSGDVANNILIKNIELGFGSDLTEVEDNVVRIYSENSLLYNYYPHSAATNLKKIGLVWYNKDEDNQYIGFSDGIYQPDYDELTYLEESATDTRLIEQKGKENIPPDETGLTFAANIAEAEPILRKISSMLTSDLYSLLLAFKQAASGDPLLTEVIDTLLLDIQSIAESLSTDASSLIPTLKKLYENILKYVYDTRNNLNVTKPTPTNIYLNIFKKISNKLDLSDITVPQGGWLGWILTAIKNKAPSSGYQEVKDNYLFRIERILSEIEKLINSLPEEMKDDYEKFSDYLNTGATKDPYGEKDYSNYGSKYCIYWYKYEEGYKDDSDGIKLMPDGWRRIINPQGGPNEGDPYIPLPSKYLDANGNSILNDAGKELHAPLMTNNQGFIYEYMENESVEQKYVAIVCYDHGIYKSNELIFKNSQEVPDKSLLDKTDAIKFIHKENSSDSYQIYSELYYLRDSADEFREREIQCKYDGLLAKDDALKNAQIYWYVPLNSTMITYDIDFLKEKGFDSDASKQMSYSKEGYICFYKQIKWDEDYGFGASIDNRSFWYKIKSYLEPSATQNHIICSVVPYAQEVKVDGTQFFTFGKSGSNGTKYTFAITNATSQSAAANGKPLPLILSLRDSNNQLVDFTINSSNFLSWMMHTLNDIGSEANIGYGEFNNKIQNFNISTSGGCGILQANTSVKIPSKAENATEENARTVQLNCLAAVPWSKEYHYYISGPTYVIYNNYGTLDSTSMFNTPYKLFDGRTHKELLVDWHIEYYVKNGLDGKWEKVTTEENVYKGYMPELDDNGALVPPTLYVDNVNCVPVVVASYGGDVYWCQPIIITQNRYPSFLLNDWDGELRIDEEGNTILSALLGAGRKNANNTFDGVLMGNVDAAAGISDGIGLYGFHQGAQSFGFKIDGTAFLGKAGKGRILFDGNYGFIASANWFTGKNAADPNTGGKIGSDGTITPSDAGLCIDLQNGHIDAFNFKLTSENINFNSNPDSGEDYMEVGNDDTYIKFTGDGKLTMVVSEFLLKGAEGAADQTIGDIANATITAATIAEKLGTTDGFSYENGKLSMSASNILAGIIMSKNFNGTVYDDGSIVFPGSEDPQGMCIDLNHGNIWTPILAIKTNGSGQVGGWEITQQSLQYNLTTIAPVKRFFQVGDEDICRDYITFDGGYHYETGSPYYHKMLYLQKAQFANFDKFYYKGRGDGTRLSVVAAVGGIYYGWQYDSPSEFVEVGSLVPSNCEIIVFQSYSFSKYNVVLEVYGILQRTYYSILKSSPPEWTDSPLFVVGAPSADDFWKGRLSVCEDGTVYLGYQDGVGYATITGNSMGFFDDKGVNLAKFGVENFVQLDFNNSSNNIYYTELRFRMEGIDDKFNFEIKDNNDIVRKVMTITNPASQVSGQSSVIHTKGGFAGLQHTREQDVLGRLKVGVGHVEINGSDIPTGALELFNDYTGTKAVARLDLFHKDNDDITLRVGGHINGEYITFPLTFHYETDEYGNPIKKLYFAGALVHTVS